MHSLAIRALLARVPALTAQRLQALLAAADQDLTRILQPEALGRIELPPATRSSLCSPDERELDRDLDWIQASGARLVACIDRDYPAQLLQVPAAPAVLYVLGSAALLASKQLAIVGSRKPTPAGRRSAREFAACLARAGLTITSGMAAGIDAASHEGALASGGETLAVCGTGLDQVYPAQHAVLAARIRERGALVSQFPPRTPALRANFPRRNGLIATLSRATLVVEAARQSGALITAKHARQHGRVVFAIPGSIHNPLARGCHALIRSGAKLVETPRDVLLELEIPFLDEALASAVGRPRRAPPLDKGYEMLLDACDFEPQTVDVLATRTGLPYERIAPMLLVLELDGHIATYPGGRFGRIP